MKKFLTRTAIVLGGLYLTLHIIVGSSPVQRRVLDEIRAALSKFGIDLRIESIEFSAFAPRLYLNRVTVSTTKEAIVQLDAPLGVDKIKIEFQPLALIYKQIVIDELTLFHPKIVIPEADALYHRFMKILSSKSKMAVKGGSFQVVFRKIGVIDAFFNVVSHEPSLALRSRSLSAYFEQSARGQQTIGVESRNIEFERGELEVLLSKTDVDVDLSESSVRINKGILEGKDFYLRVKGVSGLPPPKKSLPDSVRLTYEAKLPLSDLHQIPELELRESSGFVTSQGNIDFSKGNFSGTGGFGYENVQYDGNRLGSGKLNYVFNEKRLELKNVDLAIADGAVGSSFISLGLSEESPVQGELSVKGVKLESLLSSLKISDPPVQLKIDGKIGLKGKLRKDLQLEGDSELELSNLLVINDVHKPLVGDNRIISVAQLKMSGPIKVSEMGLSLTNKISALDGSIEMNGFVGFGGDTVFKFQGQNLSLSRLKSISDIPFGGRATINGSMDITDGTFKIGGAFDVQQAEIADIVLGHVKGTTFYENDLLSFENLEMAALEPVYASGFIDFHPKLNHYKFDIQGRRVTVNEAFDVFRKIKLDFPIPRGGESSVRVTLEGGHDNDGIDVSAVGQARNIQWYEENWLSSQFNVRFRPKATELNRATLIKRSGGLEAKGHFEGHQSDLFLTSHGLKLEELNVFGKAPLQGEIVGGIRLKGDLRNPEGEGQLRLTKALFRGAKVEDSELKMRTIENTTEFFASIMGEKLKGRMVQTSKGGKKQTELMSTFKEYDIAPLLTILLGKDVPPIQSVVVSGDLSLKNVLGPWQEMSGSATFSTVNAYLKTTTMKNESPVHFNLERGRIGIERVRLTGPESTLVFDYSYEPDKSIHSNIDGKIDLQYLQPFIPGLEYGVGKVSAGIRISGTPMKIDMLGNLTLEDGFFRIIAIQEEFKDAKAQLSFSQDRINVDRLEANVGSGNVLVRGDVRINRFRDLIPNLEISVNKVALKTENFLTTRFTGELFIKGDKPPYLLGGRCNLLDAKLTSFNMNESESLIGSDPIFKFDVRCDAKGSLFVETEVMNAEFKGKLRLAGDTDRIGLLGDVEAKAGYIIFKETRFQLETGTVKFEEANKIAPRFNVAGRTIVKEQKTQVPQSYEVNLQVFGTPTDYKIRLTSSPSLPESELISLLILGVTSQSQDGNYVDFGTTIVGQTPLQSKIQSELGLDIKVGAQGGSGVGGGTGSNGTGDQTTVPNVRIQKEVMKNTKVTVSNTLESVPLKEFKIEHMLNDNFTVNGSRSEKTRGSVTQEPSAAYGVDVRYRFTFE